MRKCSDDPKCSENVLEVLNVDIEDPECGSIMEIVEHIIKEERKVRSEFKVRKCLVCRIDRVAKGSFEHKCCPSDWVKEGKIFDYFLLVEVEKGGKDICIHVECKETERKNVYIIVNKLKEKKDGYLHFNDCFCFSDATPKTAAVIRVRGDREGAKRKIKDIEHRVKEIKFDYCIIKVV